MHLLLPEGSPEFIRCKQAAGKESPFKYVETLLSRAHTLNVVGSADGQIDLVAGPGTIRCMYRPDNEHSDQGTLEVAELLMPRDAYNASQLELLATSIRVTSISARDKTLQGSEHR